MATAPITPQVPSSGSPQPGGGPAGASPDASQSPAMAVFARIAMLSQQAASQYPEAAPMMREVQNSVRQATMKVIQGQSAPSQPTPQI